MPVNVAVEEPRARVIRAESKCHIVSCIANTDDVTPNRVGVVVCRAASHTDNIEVMSVQMEGVLGKEALRQMNILASRKLTFNPPGMETSTVEFFGRV